MVHTLYIKYFCSNAWLHNCSLRVCREQESFSPLWVKILVTLQKVNEIAFCWGVNTKYLTWHCWLPSEMPAPRLARLCSRGRFLVLPTLGSLLSNPKASGQVSWVDTVECWCRHAQFSLFKSYEALPFCPSPPKGGEKEEEMAELR